MNAFRHIFRQSLQHPVTAMFVNAVQLCHLCIEAMHRNVLDRNLVDGGRMKVRRLLHQDELADDGLEATT